MLFSVVPNAAFTALTTLSPAASDTSDTTTRAPSLANSSAAVLPMPLPPPVMIVTLPSSRMVTPLGVDRW